MQDESTRPTIKLTVGGTTHNLPQLTEAEWKSLDWEVCSEQSFKTQNKTPELGFQKLCASLRSLSPLLNSPEESKHKSNADEMLSAIIGDPIVTCALSHMKPSPKTKQVIIGICGHKQHGKDTIANYFTSYRSGFVQLAFADPLKDAIKVLFNVSDEQLYNPKEKEVVDPRWNVTPRQMMQKLGTFVRNDFSEDFFVNHLSMRCFGIPRVCISDVRRQNEANFIKERGGIIIKVFRPEMEDSDTHESETDIKNIKEDYFVLNDGNIVVDLYGKLDRIMEDLVSSGKFTVKDIGGEKWKKLGNPSYDEGEEDVLVGYP